MRMFPKITKAAITLSVALFMMLSLFGCAADVPPPAGDTYVTVVDQAGRTVEITQPVERIVSVFYISTSLCITLSVADRLVGIEARADERPIYALSMPQLLDLPVAGTARDFSIETALEMEPDLVIVPMRQRDNADVLMEIGVPAIVVNPENIQALRETIMLVSEATGSQERAETLLAFIDDSLAEFERLTATINEKPVVYMGGVSSYLSTSPDDMFQASLIRLAGGINALNIPGDSRVEISYEQLLAMDPDIIIIPPEAVYSREDILTNPVLQNLRAVINGRVYQMPYEFEAWDSPIPSFTLGVRWLLTVLHEGLYSTESFLEAVSAFYYEFFNFDAS
jgi:iron complex transport system substrate-binding protein